MVEENKVILVGDVAMPEVSGGWWIEREEETGTAEFVLFTGWRVSRVADGNVSAVCKDGRVAAGR